MDGVVTTCTSPVTGSISVDLTTKTLEGPAFAVVGGTKARPGSDVEPSKELGWKGKLVVGVEADRNYSQENRTG